MVNRGFGPFAPRDLPTVEIPVGERCHLCDEAIGPADSGVIMTAIDASGARLVAVHRECEIRHVVGSVGHIRGLCTCHGGPGTLDDPPGVSKRVAALLAEREFLMGERTKGSTNGKV